MKQELAEPLTEQEKVKQVVPCQLKKKPNCPCSMICAFKNGCPVYYVDEHNNPLIR